MHRLTVLTLLIYFTSPLERIEAHLIDGIFTEPTLEPGYNLVATIPRGALALNVTELRHTQNYLAIRLQDGSYLLNGNYNINWSGEYKAAGTTFFYIRQSPLSLESFSAAGPLREPIDVMVLYQEPNPGIVYRYIIPGSGNISPTPHLGFNAVTAKSVEPSAPTHKRVEGYGPAGGGNGTLTAFSKSTTTTAPQHSPRRYKKKKFAWKSSGYTECNKSCGGGTQAVKYICVREHNQAQVPEKRCHAVEKPREVRVRCNVRPCPPNWRFGSWTECSGGCGSGERTRELECVQEVRAGLTMVLHDGACTDPKIRGPLREVCPMPACERKAHQLHEAGGTSHATDSPAKWAAGAWSQCSVSCGQGRITRIVSCLTPDYPCNWEDKPASEEMCDLGPCPLPLSNAISENVHAPQWLYTEWSEKCSAECGTGVQTRRTFCQRNGFESFCLEDNRPETSRACSSNRTCSGQWFTGPWSECSSECDVGEQVREAVCVTSLRGALRVVLDMNCPANKPETRKACQAPACTSSWFVSDWSECSRSCGKGLQKREVACFTADGLPPERHQVHCKEEDRPASRRTCNDYPCKEDVHGSEKNHRTLQVQDDPEISNVLEEFPHCKDTIPNCNLVIQARLCTYPYYQQSCCLSCARAKHELE